ncbi:MAG: hypothetical protein IJH39_08420 [Clostridia bacterium]|nr:hypothetical protein [Clostridia bacterium]
MLHLNKDITTSKPVFDWNKTYMPKPRMLGTEYVGSDRYAVVCVSVDSPKRITVKRVWELDENNVKEHPNIDIDDEGVMWAIDINKFNMSEDGKKWSLRTNKRGKESWHEMGSSSRSSSIHWGIADPYRDPNF